MTETVVICVLACLVSTCTHLLILRFGIRRGFAAGFKAGIETGLDSMAKVLIEQSERR